MADPVTYVEQRFEQLKSFMRRQPSSWAKTGDPVIDAANRARMDLADTAVKYADSIAEGLKIAAKIYDMAPGHPKITIHFANTPNDQVDLRQQKRIVKLHEEFQAYIREHGIFLSSGNSAPKPSAGAMPSVKQETGTAPTPNFFYFDANGQKFGPVNENQLKSLASQGHIVPQTRMETDTGYKGQAGQIPGLFATPAQPSFQSHTATQNQSVPHGGGGMATTSRILGYIGIFTWIIPLFGLPVTIIGLVMGIKGKSNAGTILCIIGLILSVVNAAIGAYMGIR